MRIQERGMVKGGGGGGHELGMDNISENKQSSGMAPMSETCKETPRTSSPGAGNLERGLLSQFFCFNFY